MIAFILGRQPEISLAELQAVFGVQPQLVTSNVALLDIDRELALSELPRMGSILRAAEVIDDNFTFNHAHLDELTTKVFAKVDGKITLGVSFFDKQASKRSAINISQSIRERLIKAGNSVRLVPSDDTTLSTATVLHNKLATGNPKKVELNFIRITKALSPRSTTKILQVTSPTYVVTRTIYVQDITAYTFRDRERPRRDARNGMLPPKLAQTMINLARSASTGATNKSLILDPFCGTGVVLQEAALMGMNVCGTDLNPTMINYSQINLDWLAHTHRVAVNAQLTVGNACNFNWKTWLEPQAITLIASETYLGHPYTTAPSMDELYININNCDTIIGKFLRNLAKQLASGTGICLGVPAWFINDRIYHLHCIDKLSEYDFNNKAIGANLIYHRPEQIVGRELLVLQKR
ncbi:MAG: hypothetical protein Q4C83_00315 [Candidatus Saccharibacteria bacterium]|nr:hypothetical protein [Candidatus Saccharibacteria bacterium]